MTAAESFPPEFVERMRRILGKDLQVFLAALAAPAAGLRVNTIRVSPEAFASRSPFPVQALGFPGEGFTVAPEIAAGKHPYHAAGVYYLQDPGAMAVGALVGARPGERVLDLSAAPGGKATQLAASMKNRGLLVANDVSRSRARELAGNLERCGIRNAVVLTENPERIADRFGPFFDRVLVDAPCSGESMFHKSVAARADWSVDAVVGCARRQIDILRTAARLVRPGGLLVYSTCTFAPEENEEVAQAFASEAGDFELAPLAFVEGAEPSKLTGDEATTAAYRFWPHRFPGAGHFIASFRRKSGEAAGGPERARVGVESGVVKLYEGFVSEVYPGMEVAHDRLDLRGGDLFELPVDMPSVQGLRVVCPGLRLGTVRNGRFEPAHALALAAPPHLASRAVALASTDEALFRYLGGHPIESSGEPGWLPIQVDGFPLGWGKRVGSIVKNHYPKGLRWMGRRGSQS